MNYAGWLEYYRNAYWDLWAKIGRLENELETLKKEVKFLRSGGVGTEIVS